MSSVIFWLALFVMAIGVLGTLLPVIPGTPLIFLVALGYGFYEGFHKVTPLILGILFGLMVITFVVDYLAGVVGAKKYGATKFGTWGSFIGGIIGVILFNIPGLLFGPFVGAVAGEMITGRKAQEAMKVGLGTVVGLAGGAVFKFVFAAAMVAVYVKSVL